AMSGAFEGYSLVRYTTPGTFSFDVDFDSRLVTTLTEPISGSGTFTYAGPGTLILTADSSYVGDTTISGGILQVGDGGTSGSLGTGDITNNGTLAFDRSDAYTVPGAISGSGTVIQQGSGSLDLDGGSHSAGSWSLVSGSIDNGTLAAGDFDFESGSVSAILAGSGAFTKTGFGTVVLSAANTYSGTTTIAEGTLVVNGDQSGANGAVSVANGATLAGAGTVGGAVSLASGATINAGDGVGTMATSDDVTFAGGSNLNWQITSATGTAGTDWDLLAIGGALVIDASASSDPIQINVWSVLANGENGEVANFNPTLSAYSWTIATAASISGFDATYFDVNTGATNGTGGLVSPYSVDGFTVSVDGNDLVLSYSPPVMQTLNGTVGGVVSANYTTNTSASSLTLDLGLFVDYLIVGGGGGGGGTAWDVGGGSSGGGGGAGGQVLSNIGGSAIQADGSIMVTVGSGGAGGVGFGANPGAAGGTSEISGASLSAITALGGGRGGALGGAGQGGGGNADNGGGGDRGSNVASGRAGGSGVPNTITGSILTYGGGGSAGGSAGNPSSVSGGSGGGGGGTNYVGSGSNGGGGAGTANTGGGGGGASGTTVTYFDGGSGGSGIVVLRYPGSSLGSIGGTVSSFVGDGTIGENGVTYQVHTFTSSGSFDLSGVDFNSVLSATLAGDIVGAGSFIIDTAGTITLSGTKSLTGATIVREGTLSLASDGSLAASSSVTVEDGGTLAGGGTVAATTFQSGGVHAPGGTGSAVQTVAGAATYDSGSTLEWSLLANDDTAGDRGSDFDGVDISNGSLVITSGATLDLVFNGTGSSVLWADSFWDSNQSWTIIAPTNGTTIASTDGSFTLGSVSNDSGGNALASSRGRFVVETTASGVVLSFISEIPDATTSTVSASPTSLTADGSATSTLTVQLKNAAGQNLTVGGATVAFATPSSGSIGTVTDNNNGTYTATYTAGTTAGSVTITPKLGSTNFTNTTSITLTPGAASAVTSTVAASVSSLTAGGGGTSVLTVQLKDANGNNLTASGGTVTFATPSSGTIGSVTDNNNGTYSATYTAGTTAGSVLITPSLGSTPFTNTTSITLTPGAASALAITTQPAGGPSGGALSTQPVVRVVDANGNTVTGDGTTVVTAAIKSG
ncbi:MAG: beta strand repeat-containing protein, partial [Phycisphaerales bacterium]